MTRRFTLATAVPASPDEAWSWSTSIKGIKQEMWPVLKMTFPKGLFPIDMSKLTFAEIEPGRRFVEQSPLLSMRLWRHERIVTPSGDGAIVTDNVEFTPRFAPPVVGWFVKRFFEHRHAVLSRSLR